MKLPATQALYAYWASQCRGRCAPDRHDLDPAAMPGVLPYTFMLDVTGDAETVPIRLTGTRLDALFGRDLRAENFLSLWRDADRADLKVLLAGVLDGAQPAIAGLRVTPDGCAATIFELLVLPLRHGGRTHARLLCGLAPVVTPPWIGLRTVETLALASWRFVERSEVASEQARAHGLRHQHLVIYQGGRNDQVAPALASQSRVKALVARSRHTLLSNRRS